MPIEFLAQIGADILDAAVDALALATTGRPAPTHTYLVHGEPAWDHCCDAGQVTVYLESIDHLNDSSVVDQRSCAIEAHAHWVITALRCHPGLSGTGTKMPTAAELETAAEDLLEDLWALLTE